MPVSNPNPSRYSAFVNLLRQPPQAVAMMKGSPQHPQLQGTVRFWQARSGVVLAVELMGLPKGSGACDGPIFALHIHSGAACAGNLTDPFADAMSHYNPYNCLHPYHAGDLPPVFGNGGYAFQVVLTDRFQLKDVIGRTVVLHAAPDDFTTQPAGNSDGKIACGVIQPRGRRSNA